MRSGVIPPVGATLAPLDGALNVVDENDDDDDEDSLYSGVTATESEVAGEFLSF